MEIVKQNCTFSISDTTESGLKMDGYCSVENSGSVSINFNICNELGESVGDAHYNDNLDNKLSISYNVLKDRKSEFIAYSDSVIEQVLNHIENGV